MNNNLPPCIRGLKKFSKGCPQMSYNPNNGLGCPAFIEIDLSTKGGLEKIEVRECVDIYMARLMFSNNALLEGNQQVMENFRNGMLTKDDNGNVIPKPSHADVILYNMLYNKNYKLEYIDGDIKDA